MPARWKSVANSRPRVRWEKSVVLRTTKNSKLQELLSIIFKHLSSTCHLSAPHSKIDSNKENSEESSDLVLVLTDSWKEAPSEVPDLASVVI